MGKNLSLSIWQKNENTRSEENSEGVAEQPFDKRDPGCDTWT